MRSIPDKIFTRQDTFLYSPIHNLENILPFSENQSRELLKIFPSTYIHPFTQIVFNDVARNVNQRNVNRRFTLHSRTSLIRSERDRSSGWYSPEIAIGNVCVELKREREKEKGRKIRGVARPEKGVRQLGEGFDYSFCPCTSRTARFGFVPPIPDILDVSPMWAPWLERNRCTESEAWKFFVKSNKISSVIVRPKFLMRSWNRGWRVSVWNLDLKLEEWGEF